MRVSVFVSVLLVAVCLMAFGATQVFAQQRCFICGRVTTIVPVTPGSSAASVAAKAPQPSCAAMMSTCPNVPYATPTAITTTVPACPAPTAAEIKTATPRIECPMRPMYGHRRESTRERTPECVGAVFDQMKFENDHTRTLMERLQSAQPCQFADLYSQLRTNVVTHIRAQQEVLHSAFLEAPATRNWTMQSAEAQQAVLNQICALDQTSPNDELWKIRYDNLAQMIGRSNYIEEKKLWPPASKLMSADQCNSLCAAYNAQRAAVLASLPPYAVVAQTTYYPASCFVNRTMPTATENASMTTPASNQQQK